MTEEKKKKEYYPEVKEQTEADKTMDAIAESIGVYDEMRGCCWMRSLDQTDS